MNEEKNLEAKNEAAIAEEQRLAKARAELAQKLKARGAQSMTFKEYQELKAKKERQPKLKVPSQLKVVLATPFLLIVCFGVFFIPYILFQVAINKTPSDDKKTASTSSSDTAKKPLRARTATVP